MEINDKTVVAAKGARDLIRLYDVYRASTRAQIVAIQQIKRHRFPVNTELNDEQVAERSELDREESFYWHTDAVFAVRRDQVRLRLFELLDIPELS